MNEKLDVYPKVSLAQTDQPLPKFFTNGYGRYSQFQPMARGGKAELYTCYDTNLGRTVAFKTLHRAITNDDYEQRRFIREARVTAQLQHPNTVPVYDLGIDIEDRLYFTMKKVEGDTLRDVIEALKRDDPEAAATYTVERILGILIQVCNALAYAHAHGVVHRDIKPSNVLVGFFGEVILLDWGVAKVWDLSAEEDQMARLEAVRNDDPPEVEDLTGTGKRPGTPLYMSPEQVEGDKGIDERTDIYSLGVMLYELLTLQDASRGASVRETFHNIVHVDPEPPRKVAPDRMIPRALEKICMKALKKDPDKRFQTMIEMVGAFRAYRLKALQSSPDE